MIVFLHFDLDVLTESELFASQHKLIPLPVRTILVTMLKFKVSAMLIV
jgi:hypothetical protein